MLNMSINESQGQLIGEIGSLGHGQLKELGQLRELGLVASSNDSNLLKVP